MNWNDIEDIAYALLNAHPDVNPLEVRFTQMLDWVMALDGFGGKRAESNEKRLEAIQMAWYEEYRDKHNQKN